MTDEEAPALDLGSERDDGPIPNWFDAAPDDLGPEFEGGTATTDEPTTTPVPEGADWFTDLEVGDTQGRPDSRPTEEGASDADTAEGMPTVEALAAAAEEIDGVGDPAGLETGASQGSASADTDGTGSERETPPPASEPGPPQPEPGSGGTDAAEASEQDEAAAERDSGGLLAWLKSLLGLA